MSIPTKVIPQEFKMLNPFGNIEIRDCWGRSEVYARLNNNDIVKYDRNDEGWKLIDAKPQSWPYSRNEKYIYNETDNTIYYLQEVKQVSLDMTLLGSKPVASSIRHDTLFLVLRNAVVQFDIATLTCDTLLAGGYYSPISSVTVSDGAILMRDDDRLIVYHREDENLSSLKISDRSIFFHFEPKIIDDSLFYYSGLYSIDVCNLNDEISKTIYTPPRGEHIISGMIGRGGLYVSETDNYGSRLLRIKEDTVVVAISDLESMQIYNVTGDSCFYALENSGVVHVYVSESSAISILKGGVFNIHPLSINTNEDTLYIFDKNAIYSFKDEWHKSTTRDIHMNSVIQVGDRCYVYTVNRALMKRDIHSNLQEYIASNVIDYGITNDDQVLYIEDGSLVRVSDGGYKELVAVDVISFMADKDEVSVLYSNGALKVFKNDNMESAVAEWEYSKARRMALFVGDKVVVAEDGDSLYIYNVLSGLQTSMNRRLDQKRLLWTTIGILGISDSGSIYYAESGKRVNGHDINAVVAVEYEEALYVLGKRGYLYSMQLAPLTVESRRSKNDYAYEVWPNPAHNMITINTAGDRDMDRIIKIYSINGALVFSGKIERGVESDWSVDVSMLQAGVYILYIEDIRGAEIMKMHIVE